MGSHNETFDNTSGLLQYQGFWTLNGTWAAPSLGQGGSLSSSNDPNANVAFTFPGMWTGTADRPWSIYSVLMRFTSVTVPAIAFYYWGMRRSHGGLYEICIDCEPNQPEGWTEIDALNREDNGENPPVILFSQTFGEASVHQITIRNKNDTRVVPSGNSQITVDRFEIVVSDTDIASTPPPIQAGFISHTASSTLTPSGTSPTAVPNTESMLSGPVDLTSTIPALNLTPPITANSAQSSATSLDGSPSAPSSPGKKIALGQIVGFTLGFSALFLVLVLLAYCRILIFLKKSRKRRLGAAGNAGRQEYGPQPPTPSSHVVGVGEIPFSKPLSSLSSSPSDGDSLDKSIVSPRRKPGLSSLSWIDATLYSHYQSSVSALSVFTPSGSSSSNASPANGRSRREMDGGPVPLPVIRSEHDEGGVEVLPPAYGQVFGWSRRNTRPTRSRVLLQQTASGKVAP